MSDAATEAAQRAWNSYVTFGVGPWSDPNTAAIAAAREALKKVREDLQSVDGILGLLHHRGLVDSERNRADVKAALAIVQRYTR